MSHFHCNQIKPKKLLLRKYTCVSLLDRSNLWTFSEISLKRFYLPYNFTDYLEQKYLLSIFYSCFPSSFTPDFTRSQIIRTLRIKTSQGTWLTFVLNVTLPHHMLAVCQSAFPRPAWEPTLRMLIGIMVVATFIGVIFVSFREVCTCTMYMVRTCITIRAMGGLKLYNSV